MACHQTGGYPYLETMLAQLLVHMATRFRLKYDTIPESPVFIFWEMVSHSSILVDKGLLILQTHKGWTGQAIII